MLPISSVLFFGFASSVLGDCILKSTAECSDLCDDDLSDASFVAEVLVTASPINFECLRYISHIKVRA
jgi:hypothetical protein